MSLKASVVWFLRFTDQVVCRVSINISLSDFKKNIWLAGIIGSLEEDHRSEVLLSHYIKGIPSIFR